MADVPGGAHGAGPVVGLSGSGTSDAGHRACPIGPSGLLHGPRSCARSCPLHSSAFRRSHCNATGTSCAVGLDGGCRNDGSHVVCGRGSFGHRVADPTFHDQLRVTVLSDRLAQIPFGADIGLDYTAQGLNWLVCSLESTSDRRLLDSVAGVDSGPLPFE